MKKLIFLLCFLIFPVLAQDINNNTFHESNPNLILDNEAKVFQGGALVYIDGISNKPQPKTWMDKAKIRLFGSMDIPQKADGPTLDDSYSFENTNQNTSGIPSRDFFGKNKELQYISHTSDWNFIIQAMDGQSIHIQENLQFLTTQDIPIARTWPLNSDYFFLIDAKFNGKSIKSLLQKNNNSTSLKIPLAQKGLHEVKLEYVLHTPDVQNFSLPLTANDWPLIIDNMSGIILTTQQKLNDIKFLFGQNDLEIPQNFTIQTDEKENIFFKNNHVIPAFAQIKLNASIQKSAQANNALQLLSPFSLFLIAFIIMLFYFTLSGYEIYAKSLLYQLKRFKKHSENPFINWLYRMGEIIIGVFILLGLTLLISLFLKINLSFFWFLLLISGILGIILLDIFIFHPKQKEIFKIHKKQQ